MSILEDLEEFVRKTKPADGRLALAVRRMKSDRTTIRRITKQRAWLNGECTRLAAELKRCQAALDKIYNTNEAARAAVVEHYGPMHPSSENER